jgi:phage terminase small subunit
MGLRGPARNPNSRRGRAEARRAQKLQESITAAAILPDESVIDASVAPAHLSVPMQDLWRRVAGTLKPHQLAVLKVACEAFDLGQQARLLVAQEGVVINKRRHPAIDVEARAAEFFARAIGQLHLDVPSTSPEYTTLLPRI